MLKTAAVNAEVPPISNERRLSIFSRFLWSFLDTDTKVQQLWPLPIIIFDIVIRILYNGFNERDKSYNYRSQYCKCFIDKALFCSKIAEQNVFVKEQPTSNLTIKNKKQSFRNEWYCKKDWLCGNSALEKLFPWSCLLFSCGTSPTWTKNGYNDIRSLITR